MRGQSGFNLMANNISATKGMLELNARRNKKPRMCWACQKEKSTYQGKLVILPGFHKFVCKDCIDSKTAP